jgi:hypothetical protein
MGLIASISGGCRQGSGFLHSRPPGLEDSREKKAVLHEEDYKVTDGPMRLSVLVGEKQFGSSMVFLNDELIANGIVDELPVGNGNLDGCTLTIYTLVTDIRDNTDDMSVTWILTGGAHRLSATETGSVSKKFGSQMFKAVFHLAGA